MGRDRQRGSGLSGDTGEVASSPIELRDKWFFTIGIDHIPTGEHVAFEGWVTDFSDTYTTQWNEEPVYGRMDPLSTYQGTRRQITLGFDIVNDSLTRAQFNMDSIAKFLKFQYPVYENTSLNQQNTLKAAPLLALKWTNLISSPNNKEQKLIGYINGGVSYAPDMGEGGFLSGEIVDWARDNRPLKEREMKAIRNYIPKRVSLNFTFTVLHTHLVGWAPVPSWGGMSDEAIRAAQAGGQGPRGVEYVFGNKEVSPRFPNIYRAFKPDPQQVGAPPPPDRRTTPQTDAELRAAYDLADEGDLGAVASEVDGFEEAEGYKRMAKEQIDRMSRDTLVAEKKISSGGFTAGALKRAQAPIESALSPGRVSRQHDPEEVN